MSISLGRPLPDLPCEQAVARPPASSLKRMYGLPLMVMGSAFCAPTLPSSQVSALISR